MEIKKNIDLKDYLTMKIGGKAAYLVDITNKNDVVDVMNWVEEHQMKFFVLGGGSNTLAKDEGFDGIIIHNMIKGIEKTDEDSISATYRVGAGEVLDHFIHFTIQHDLSGMEAMSMIPGTIGATPVQNVGAYGQEIADTFVELIAYDTLTKAFVTLSKKDLHFSYRNSVLKHEAWGRYIICDVTVRLHKSSPKPPFYAQVQQLLDKQHVRDYTPQVIREAVIQIRTNKLPDPHLIPNSGSFFKNSVITNDQLNELNKEFPDLKGFVVDEKHVKISTGWLIDQSGLKGQKIGHMRVHDKNALVLTNVDAQSYHDLASAREIIKAKVFERFGITIEQEVLEIA